MKKKMNNSLLKTAAFRVKILFSSGKLYELQRHFLEQAASSKTFSQSHHCNLVKSPRVPLVLGIASKMPKKGEKKCLTVSEGPCPRVQTRPNPEEGSGKELSPNRVSRWRLKEYVLAARKLKGDKKEKQATLSKHHEISLIEEQESQFSEDMEKNEAWQEYIKSKGERQFHLTRVIKYLMD